MSKVTGRKKIKAFSVSKSYMFRLAGSDDAIGLCRTMREILVEAKRVFATARVDQAAYEILQIACDCTEKAFGGKEAPELFEAYYLLGVQLLKIGYEDLGVSCHYLHHAFQNRSSNQWPAVKVWNQSHGADLLQLIPIFPEGFPDFEADTGRDGPCLS